ncbi:MAG TPA: DUF2202 domain-containing protein [Sediminibacterium sp.]|nr:MAG: hypothetical protein B7X72_06690 [Sphingobacteriia bacterium 39-39-8]HQR92121.1 DUF2202 domain-containing protein [Sediminibacterium sp.]HQS54866.1 DUF2202 domain-containing protein [Sediminibacterium sp.]
MKRLSLNLSLYAILIAISILGVACSKNDVTGAKNENNSSNLTASILALPKETLSEEETKSILHLREEEKLARDVYYTLNLKYNANVFANIKSSEESHMDTMLQILNKYGIPDPVATNGIGVFKDSGLQNLYNQLVTTGNQSLLDAYKVGATIEDLDLFDLADEISLIDNQDILLVYDNLAKGSRNHMRSFYKNIIAANGNYSPQFISQNTFDSIINSAMETGF